MENKSGIFLGIIGTALLLCLVMNKESNHTDKASKTSRKSYERYTRYNDERPTRYDYSYEYNTPRATFDLGYKWTSYNNNYGFSFSYGNARPVYRPVYRVVSQE